ncbi:S26 family signal peptidase [Pediococcus siamensis]|uniref:S26 family signal peptidase n=1 Tax=Pediococcus siamensis TaxID=381829 RepID=UPI0039A26E0A
MKVVKQVLSWVVPILIGFMAAVLLRTYVFQIIRVDGSSMTPNLVNNGRSVPFVYR